MKPNQQPAPGSIQITMTPRQLDVIMCSIEGMFEGGSGAGRTLQALAKMVEGGAEDWAPDYNYDGFGCDLIVIAPVYRQMIEAWGKVDIARNSGNEFANVFEFVEALKVARTAAGVMEESRA